MAKIHSTYIVSNLYKHEIEYQVFYFVIKNKKYVIKHVFKLQKNRKILINDENV